MKTLTILGVTLAVMCGGGAALGREISVELGDELAEATGAEPSAARPDGAVGGSYWTIGENFNLAIAPNAPAGRATMVDGQYVVGLGLESKVRINDIAQIRYTTRTAKMPANVNISFIIFTEAGSDAALGGDDGASFQRQLTHEPLYAANRGRYDDFFQPDVWNRFTAVHEQHPMTFYDRHHGPAGFVGPTLEQIQQADASSAWTEFGKAEQGFDETPYAYGNSAVKYFVLQTSSDEGNWKNFKADLDALVVELVDGDVIFVDFNRGRSTVTVEAAPGAGGSTLAYVIVGVLIIVIVLVAALAARKARRQAG